MACRWPIRELAVANGRGTGRDETCGPRWTAQALPSPALLIPSPLWLPPQQAEPPPPTSQHHTNRPPLTTTDGPGEQEWCPSAPHNFDATWSWPGACWHSRRSSLPPCPGCAQSTPEAAHLGRCTAVTLGAVSAGSSRQHVRQAGGLCLVRAHMCVKRPPGRAARPSQPEWSRLVSRSKSFAVSERYLLGGVLG